jgi:hypothetical protein
MPVHSKPASLRAYSDSVISQTVEEAGGNIGAAAP